MTRDYLAMDFGGSNGRGILGHFDGERISLTEIRRFPNYFVEIQDICYWDILKMFYEVKQSLGQGVKAAGELASIGIDTWGTDYGLLDPAGHLLGSPVCVRNTLGEGRKKVEEFFPGEELYQRTGTHTLDGNTLFQLYERRLRKDTALEHAKTLLMLPDLLGYFLTGEKVCEYSNGATTMAMNPVTRQWDEELITMLGLPEEIFPSLTAPGNSSFHLRSSVQKEMNLQNLKYAPVLTHDTASAIAAVPLREGEAFCSSGTWSIMGMETRELVVNPKAGRYNFSSAWTMGDAYSMHRDFMGMWMIQECRREWEMHGNVLGWEEIVGAAREAEEFACFIDVDMLQFFNTGQMIHKIQDFCRETGQWVPDSIGAVTRCVYESIAMRYRQTFWELQEAAGTGLNSLRILGGGSKNRFMNQLVANAIGKPVVAGPDESASVGNLLVQAMADGQLQGLGQLREVVGRSFPADTYEPCDTEKWNGAYGKYIEIKGKGDRR